MVAVAFAFILRFSMFAVKAALFSIAKVVLFLKFSKSHFAPPLASMDDTSQSALVLLMNPIGSFP